MDRVRSSRENHFSSLFVFFIIKKLIAEKEYSKMYFSERLELGNQRLPEIVVS